MWFQSMSSRIYAPRIWSSRGECPHRGLGQRKDAANGIGGDCAGDVPKIGVLRIGEGGSGVGRNQIDDLALLRGCFQALEPLVFGQGVRQEGLFCCGWQVLVVTIVHGMPSGSARWGEFRGRGPNPSAATNEQISWRTIAEVSTWSCVHYANRQARVP